ncbi:molybdenum cofactor biosynthesis protein A [Exophiala spinifera]|uniref:GTP 3',8-cyclase n=1 Tax=Exophiala spinifera TaxID=91928 RepID=A0A0D2ATB1_9EURO|nr:molybdenum cofactor biosynthesis protein A [Exophiala spinifera]KIW09948.1 molybdenum cofactor biosynthesis protein A [Exophiala spinifera]
MIRLWARTHRQRMPVFRHGRSTFVLRQLAKSSTTTKSQASSSDVTEQASKVRLRKDTSLNDVKPFSEFLTDSYSRRHNYLRISITERCNLRCLYCMPEEGVQLSPPSHNLTSTEITYLSRLFVEQGVTKIRLTGGEPTVRKDIVELVQSIGDLRSIGLKEICITTNGISLARKLDSLVAAGLSNINLSLDTLDPYQYTLMTRRNGFDAVMKSISKILELKRRGTSIKFKINCVVMKGLNDGEVVAFSELGRNEDVEVRFIEYMPFDGNRWSKGKMITYRETLDLIRQKYPDVHRIRDQPNDTSKTYKIPGFVGRIGFVTSMTENFCSTCNRLRITSDGNLKVCLFGKDEVSLRDILRGYNNGQPLGQESEPLESWSSTVQDALSLSDDNPRKQLLHVIGMAVKRKAQKHADLGDLEKMQNRPMILIGG